MNKVFKKGDCKKALLLLAVLVILICMGQYKSAEAASNPYLIKVNKQQNTVTVYKKDAKGNYTVPHKAMVCSAGWDTPIGTFKTPAKYRWRLLMGDVWGQYSTRIHGGILFHSVWYYQQNPSTLSARQYNKLGTTASHGCIRLTVADAKWIYDNCPIGTTVTIYNSKDPGPLGKPTAAILPSSSGWDPTDTTNPNNPWNKKNPSISASDQTVKYGTKVNLLTGVTAKSTTGANINSRVKVTGKVDSKTAGKYKITYNVTDQVGKTAKKTVTFTVLADDTKPSLKGVKDQTVNGSVKINRSFALKGVTGYFNKDKVNNKLIDVKVTKKSATLYNIAYVLTSDTGNTAKATAKITVDATSPEFVGVEDRDIAWDQVVDNDFALKGVSATDNITKLKKKDITVDIIDNEDGTYFVTYTVSDGVGNKTSEEVLFTVVNTLEITGVTDRTIQASDLVTEEMALEGVKAEFNGTDITDQIVVTISSFVDNKYTITYYVEDEEGDARTEKAVFTVEEVVEVSDGTEEVN